MLNAKFPKPGETFAERYRIKDVLNRGGFSQVFRAEQVDLGRVVAIKILRPVNITEDTPNRDERLHVIVERFKREARTVSQLNDARTVQVYDYGSTESGLMYMVMEYVPGNDLNEVISKSGKLAPDRVVRIADQVLASLDEAHALELVHRDVKPANIMLYDNVHEKDLVKLLDFGLVKSMESDPLFTDEDPGLTGDDNIVGTPRYMAPEQIRGESLDARSDLYSLGLVMYEMLTGEKALDDDTAMKVIAKALSRDNIVLQAEAAPPSLTQTVNALLEKHKEKRPSNAADVRKALVTWSDAIEEIIAVPISEDLLIEDFNFEPREKNRAVWLLAPIILLLLIAVMVLSIGKPEVTDSVAEQTDDRTEFVFDEAEELPAEQVSIQAASEFVFSAVPDAQMLEFAMTAVGERTKLDTIQDPPTKKTRKKKKKKKKIQPKELKIRTLDQ